MDQLDGDSLDDFLDLAVRHHFIESYELTERGIIIVQDGVAHQLDPARAWAYLSGLLYEWWHDQAFEP